MTYKEKVIEQTIISKDMMDNLFFENTVNSFAAHINSEFLSIGILSGISLLGILIVYQTTKNLKLINRHHKQTKNNSEFDTVNNKTLKTAEMDNQLIGSKRIPFRKWITEPPSMTTVQNIKNKRKFKAIINIIFLCLGATLIVSPFVPLITTQPYSISFNYKNITINSLFDENVIPKSKIENIKIDKVLKNDGSEYFYPRCKITINTKDDSYSIVVKDYNMEKIRLNSCYKIGGKI